MNVIQDNVPTGTTACNLVTPAAIATGTGAALSTECYFSTTDGMQFFLPADGALGSAQANIAAHCSDNTSATQSACTTAGGNWFPATNDTSAGCTSAHACYIAVDVNGAKAPNKYTSSADNPQDRYIFAVVEENVIPVGAANDLMFAR